MLVVPLVPVAASFDGMSVLAAAADPAMHRLLGMRPYVAAWASLPLNLVAAIHRLYWRNAWNGTFLLAVCFSFVSPVCIAAVSVAAASCDCGLPQPHRCCSLLIASIVTTMRTSLFRVLLSSSALLLPA